jgi:hypothetical protein
LQPTRRMTRVINGWRSPNTIVKTFCELSAFQCGNKADMMDRSC